MITIDYKISPEWEKDWSAIDLTKANETDLTFRVLLGDIAFRADSVDFSAPWGWIPLIDFAAAMKQVAGALEKDGTTSDFEFTESDAKLHFERKGSNVIITASYAPGAACVSALELIQTIRSFVRHFASETVQKYPALAGNQNLKHLL